MAGVLENVRAEDYVEYFIFPEDDTDVEVLLENIKAKVDTYTQEFIWHRDPFHLSIGRASQAGVDTQEVLPIHFYGVTHFGDNIEDEWFIVSLLIHLTRQFPGLVVRVVDSDGEFLLIEAADNLPQWAGPETCANRVYLYGGCLHLVTDGVDSDSSVTVLECIGKVRDKQVDTKASDEIQAAIQHRVQGYPGKFKESLHHCNVFVPAAVAALLEERPQLVAPAVLAFCDRDPIDMKACRAMRFFPPETRVLARVTFTRCLYASMIRQRFTPDRCTGWSLPAPTSQQFAPHEMGAKLASGFEVLVARAKPKEGEESRAWLVYLEKLKARGYFQGMLEGSKGHSQKLSEAREFFDEHGPNAGEAVGESIVKLLSSIEVDAEKLRAKAAALPPSDSDSWLEVSPQELDALLFSRYGSPRKGFPNRSEAANIPGQLNKFLEHVSGVEGAEFPGNRGESSPPVRPKRGVKKGKGAGAIFTSQTGEQDLSSSPASSKINLNPEAFSCAVQNILDFMIPDDNWDLESNSDMSSLEDEASTAAAATDMEAAPTGAVDKKVLEYMKQMDQELEGTTMAHSFEREVPDKATDDSFEDIEDFRPVDINLTALRNVLASYESEMGVAPGPASSLLGPMGVHLETILHPDKDNVPVDTSTGESQH